MGAVTVPGIGGDKCYHGADSRVGAGAQACAWAIKIYDTRFLEAVAASPKDKKVLARRKFGEGHSRQRAWCRHNSEEENSLRHERNCKQLRIEDAGRRAGVLRSDVRGWQGPDGPV